MSPGPTLPFVQITPADLAVQIEAGTAPRILDIREPWEWKIAHLEQAELKPLSQVQHWWHELDPAEVLVIHCHRGNRSAQLCYALAAEGFGHLVNLDGGLDRWSTEVDSGVPRY